MLVDYVIWPTWEFLTKLYFRHRLGVFLWIMDPLTYQHIYIWTHRHVNTLIYWWIQVLIDMHIVHQYAHQDTHNFWLAIKKKFIRYNCLIVSLFQLMNMHLITLVWGKNLTCYSPSKGNDTYTHNVWPRYSLVKYCYVVQMLVDQRLTNFWLTHTIDDLDFD